MPRRGVMVGALAAGAAVLAMTGITTAQVSRSVAVTVVDANGIPVVNAQVCIGTATDRAALGGARTNAGGTASLTIPAATSGTVLITGGTAAAGSQITMPAVLALATLRLPASGGPACPSTTRPAAIPGQIAIPQGAIDQALAANAARAPIARVGTINLGKGCFGAAGQNCGGWTGAGLELSSCNPVTHTCSINAGSWQHDECCIRNPQGAMCDGKMEELVGSGQVCQAEFEMAVKRLPTPFTWSRSVDFEARNATGIVDHGAYCAPAGTFVNVAAAEQRFCCTRQARRFAPVELLRVPASVRTLVPLADIRVCT